MQSHTENENDFDMAAFVQDQKEKMNELLLKRSQVQQLRKELDATDTKIFNLSRKLDEANRTKTDMEHVSKRMRHLEDKLREQKDTGVTSNVNLAFENGTLKDKLEKAHVENKNLLRQIEDLNVQHQNDVFYRKELMKEDAKVQSVINKCTETVEKLEIDSKFLEVLNAVDLCEKQQNAIEFYKNKNTSLEKEKQSLEGQFVNCKAKLETLENLLESYPVSRRDSSLFYDETLKIISNLRDEVGDQREQIKSFTVKLRTEMDVNAQLVERNAANAVQIEELKQKLAAFTRTLRESSTQTENGEKEISS